DRIGHRSFFANNTGLPGLAPSPRTARAQNRAAPAMGMPAAPLARGGRLRDENGNPVNFGARTTRTFRPTSVHADEQGSGRHATISSLPIDRTFVLRQYKPIPATIVNEVRADARTMGPGPGNMGRLPVMATVDRNVFADNGRTIILPAGTQMMGYVTGELPGPYRTIGRMQINWYRFIRPDNVEFNFQQSDNRPFAADAQGRTGVPGRGSTDYIESMIMPMMTALVPAAVNLIAPISDRFVNQIDLDNNTVTQTGTVRSSELAKQEIISSWNQVVQRLVLDMMDNTTPPFSIAAGTRITVFSPTDLVVTCADADADPNADPRSCAMVAPNMEYADFRPSEVQLVANFDNVSDWMGQVRSLNVRMDGLCETDFNGNFTGRPVTDAHRLAAERGIDFRAVVFHCQSGQFQAMNNVRWNQFFNQQHQLGQGNQVGMTQMPGLQPQQPIFSPEFQQNQLGMQVHPETGLLLNPFAPLPPPPPGPAVLLCEDGTHPDSNGCCTGEILTDMGDLGMNCCPVTGGDCFPPLQ
ncbi:MAG: hypothetical protein FWE17_00475, partial [Alphaproteobacteria bacterium]|nr:hypothetical protein [Alphaproteobacteria bacterium]